MDHLYFKISIRRFKNKVNNQLNRDHPPGLKKDLFEPVRVIDKDRHIHTPAPTRFLRKKGAILEVIYIG